MCETSNSPAFVARVGVFGEDAVAILDRHVVARERRETRAVFAVQGVKRGELNSVMDRPKKQPREACLARPLCRST